MKFPTISPRSKEKGIGEVPHVITGHHRHRPELQAFCQVHSADRSLPAAGFDVLVEHLERQPGLNDSWWQTADAN